jgi:integrase
MICHVFRRGSTYWGKLRLDGEHRVSAFSLGTTDKRVALAKLLDAAKEREREAAGLLPPQSVREAAATPPEELLTAFLEDLKAKGRADTTHAKYKKTLTKLFVRCRWRLLADASARSFCEWRAKCGLSPKTLNDLLGALMTFFGWLRYQRRLAENPLEHVQRIDTRATRRQHRRALTADELARLIATAPPHRSLVYRVAAYTGLRRAEMMALQWADFTLEGPSPCVRARASITKNRKDAVIPLHPEVVAALLAHKPADASPFALVLAGLVPRIPTFRKDLTKAGITFVDDSGRRADLHSLRMTFGTNLTLAGAVPRAVQELMRHSDLKLSMQIYTDASQLPLFETVKRLPFTEKHQYTRQSGGMFGG